MFQAPQNLDSGWDSTAPYSHRHQGWGSSYSWINKEGQCRAAGVKLPKPVEWNCYQKQNAFLKTCDLVQKVNAFPDCTFSIVPFRFHSFNFSKTGQVRCFLPLWNTSHRMKKGKKWISDTISSGYVTIYQWWGWGDGEADMLHAIIYKCLFLNVNTFSSSAFFLLKDMISKLIDYMGLPNWNAK